MRITLEKQTNYKKLNSDIPKSSSKKQIGLNDIIKYICNPHRFRGTVNPSTAQHDTRAPKISSH